VAHEEGERFGVGGVLFECDDPSVKWRVAISVIGPLRSTEE